MATAKITGGDSVKTVRLYFERVHSGTKNLAQANTFRKLEKMEQDFNKGKITEEEFVERQSDILTAFTARWGDPVPPSEETPEQKAERQARKARKKAVDKKLEMALIAENGFEEGYTIILTGSFTNEESDRIKALDDPTREVYIKTHKPFREYLQEHYRADYGAELRLLTVLEEGERSGLLHTHHMLSTPFQIDEHSEETISFLKWVEDCWNHYSGAEVARAEIAHKVGGVWAFAPYISKCFFNIEKHKKGKHYYWATDNLRHLEIEKREIPDEELKKIIGKLRNSEDEAVAYIEDSPVMKNRRVLNLYFHDVKDRIDDITFVEFIFANITKDIEEGNLGKRRSVADTEIWEDAIPMFLRIKHYGEDATSTSPKIPFDVCEWIIKEPITPNEEEQHSRDTTTPLSTLPRQREIISNGLRWFENLPVPQEGRRIVCSNCLIFDELII